MTIANSTISGNKAGGGGLGTFQDGGRGGDGGGVFGAADVSIINSTIQLNQTGSAGEGDEVSAAGSGGGVSNVGTLTLDQSDVIGNTTGTNGDCGGEGGGIRSSGVLMLRQSLVANNEAITPIREVNGSTCASGSSAGGGGIAHFGQGLIEQSTITGNQALNNGGGIFLSNPDVTIINSTVSGNDAGVADADDRFRDGSGGGVGAQGGTLVIISSTIAGNTAEVRGGGIQNGDFKLASSPGTVTLRSAIVAGNESSAEPDCHNADNGIASSGFNLVGEDTGCPADHPEDLTVDPATVFTDVIGPLTDNGGPTPTHALLEESPAIDAGSCTDAEGDAILTDQRGEPRPSVDPGGSGDGAGCDISAFEFQFEVGVDESAPEIALSEGPLVLWPPNSAYRTLDVSEMIVSVTDDQDESLSADDVVIAAVSSDEADDAVGSGRTGDDVVISSNCRSVDLRAERAGGGNGRVYTVELEAADASGNVGTAFYQVHVLQNKRDRAAIDDGEAFRVAGSCGTSDLAVRAGHSAEMQVLNGAETPAEYDLVQNYPNPFNPSTEIAFALPEAAEVRLVVYDALGRTVARLVDGALPAGRHRVQWNAANLASGVYVYRLTAGSFESTRRMIFLK